jgi:hypothetical protein
MVEVQVPSMAEPAWAYAGGGGLLRGGGGLGLGGGGGGRLYTVLVTGWCVAVSVVVCVSLMMWPLPVPRWPTSVVEVVAYESL